MKFTVIDEQLERVIAKGDVPGFAAAVINAKGTIFQKTAGVAAIGDETPVTADSVFWIASMTKPITTIAALQLVEQGKLHLDVPAADVLPELGKLQILENGALRPAKKQVTLRQLLTHTSGFSYDFASVEYVDYLVKNNIPAGRGKKASYELPLLFEPGERWEYGIGIDWAGMMVEAASGMDLEAYFQTHIFVPLGMKDTSFVPAEALNVRRVAIHQRLEGGALRPNAVSTARRPEVLSGGGGLFSTLNDYQKFLSIFLNEGAGIVSPAMIEEMGHNQIGQIKAGVIPTENPAFMTASDLSAGQDTKFTLGFLIYPEALPTGRKAGSLVWLGAANTYFWIDQASGIAGIMLMQILPLGDPACVRAFIAFEKAVYAAMGETLIVK